MMNNSENYYKCRRTFELTIWFDRDNQLRNWQRSTGNQSKLLSEQKNAKKSHIEQSIRWLSLINADVRAGARRSTRATGQRQLRCNSWGLGAQEGVSCPFQLRFFLFQALPTVPPSCPSSSFNSRIFFFKQFWIPRGIVIRTTDSCNFQMNRLDPIVNKVSIIDRVHF